jgi:hypothetical protein
MSASTAKTSIASTRAGFFLYDAEWANALGCPWG